MIRCPRFFVALLLALVSLAVCDARAQRSSLTAPLSAPVFLFSHDSGSMAASAPENERQATRELDELARLNKAGLRTEYDLMDASWFAPESGYRSLRSADWPSGPDAWLAKCRAAGIRPGMRIDGNAIPVLAPSEQVPAAWKDSLGEDGRSLSLSEGGYLTDLVSALQSWYDRGVRLFELDSIDLAAATPAAATKMSASEVATGNTAALRKALQSFRDKNPEAVIIVSVDPGVHGNLPISSAASASSAEKSAARQGEWDQLGAFTLVSTGLPTRGAAPQANLWRTIDIQSDESVRRLEQSGVSLAQIESDGFTASGSADSGMHAWKGAFLLSMARGGWVNSIHGDLSLVEKDDARWMAHVQHLFLTLREEGNIRSFGARAGTGQSYGFAAANQRGSVYVVVNPGEATATLTLPAHGTGSPNHSEGRVQFSDAGFLPVLNGNAITLGPGQMAMVGYGAYASSSFNLGVQQDVIIPRSVEPVDANFYSTESGTLVASFQPPIDGVVRVVLRPRASDSQASTEPGGIASGPDAGQAFTLDASQYGRPIPVRMESGSKNDHGVGWTVGEIDVNDLTPGVPLVVRFHADDTDTASLQANAYAVVY
ncbi:MAG: hypothetical protein ABSD70_00640 [Terracidiphilus sp.]